MHENTFHSKVCSLSIKYYAKDHAELLRIEIKHKERKLSYFRRQRKEKNITFVVFKVHGNQMSFTLILQNLKKNLWVVFLPICEFSEFNFTFHVAAWLKTKLFSRSIFIPFNDKNGRLYRSGIHKPVTIGYYCIDWNKYGSYVFNFWKIWKKKSKNDCNAIHVKMNKNSDVDVFAGKSLSEALILASTNPQYDDRLFIELPVQYKKTTSSVHVVYTNCSLFWHSEQFMYRPCTYRGKYHWVLSWYKVSW